MNTNMASVMQIVATLNLCIWLPVSDCIRLSGMMNNQIGNDRLSPTIDLQSTSIYTLCIRFPAQSFSGSVISQRSTLGKVLEEELHALYETPFR